MDNEKGEPPGAFFGIGSVFQSSTLQRGILRYNDAHRIIFRSLYSYVLYSGRIILNLFGFEKV